MKKTYGLIGLSLAHSFSKNYFEEKFIKENIVDCEYNLYELKDISEFPALVEKIPGLTGLNVTIPYKEQIIQFLDNLDQSAIKVNAVNVIKPNQDKTLTGYNSDYYGFKESVEKWLPPFGTMKALVLGTGGSSRAVKAALEDLNIEYLSVSRHSSPSTIDYETIQEHPDIIHEHRFIINTTPLGMYPNVEKAPELPYNNISRYHYVYDLVYNPSETLFLQKAKEKGAKTKNGLEMLHLQAEKSWEIWNR